MYELQITSDYIYLTSSWKECFVPDTLFQDSFLNW
jgi:hypothetical protein